MDAVIFKAGAPEDRWLSAPERSAFAEAPADEGGGKASPAAASAKAGDFFDHIYQPTILMTV